MVFYFQLKKENFHKCQWIFTGDFSLLSKCLRFFTDLHITRTKFEDEDKILSFKLELQKMKQT